MAVDVFESIDAAAVPCPECGRPTERAWLTKPPAAIGDETDFVSHHGERHPVRFRSKSEHRRWLKEKGYTIKDEHKGIQGSDKSPHTTAWTAGGAQWLADAEELARRNGTAAGAVPDAPDDFHVQFSEGTLTPAEVARYRSS